MKIPMQDRIEQKRVDELIPADYNPRKRSQHVMAAIKQGIGSEGWLVPIVFNTHQCEKCGDRRNIIISGHRRIEAAKEMGDTEVPALGIDVHRDREEILNRQLNAQEEDDKTKLALLVEHIHLSDPEMAKLLGMSQKKIIELLYHARYHKEPLHGILAEKFLIPPFSVFDSRSGYWQDRKQAWKEVMGSLAETREGTLARSPKNLLMRGINEGVSQFDPVTSEVLFQWFLPEGGRILDNFMGDQSKAIVAAALGFDYTGIDIRQEQIDSNTQAMEAVGLGGKGHFICGDAEKIDEVIPADERFDLLFTCPPYYDLEIYSEGEADMSAKKTYGEFMVGYAVAFEKAVRYLKDNRFAIMVLGDIRDDKGFYRNFLGDNIALFKRLGFELYNEIIYIETTGTAPYRAERNMRKRKVVKTHQNIYTFYKGDPALLQNPALLERHHKVLTFFKGDPEAIKKEFKNPPPIERDIMGQLEGKDAELQAGDN